MGFCILELLQRRNCQRRIERNKNIGLTNKVNRFNKNKNNKTKLCLITKITKKVRMERKTRMKMANKF